MSFIDDDGRAARIGRDHLLPWINGDAVTEALQTFDLSLQPDRDWDWLALAVRRSLAITIPDENDRPERASNNEIRVGLKRVSSLVESTWLELFQIDGAADSRLWDFAARHLGDESKTDAGGELVIGPPPAYLRFKAAVAELDWLAGFLRQAAHDTESQRGPWRQSEQKRIRIERGHFLAPVFEAAFGEPISVNNWPVDARHNEPTAFMSFYQEMVSLAFGEHVTPNISEVLKAARQLHQRDPVLFAAGVIPGL